MNQINLGIIGMSEGNGHPYSWSSIFNGYKKEVMAECGFSVIPQYLSEHKFPEEAIAEARVSHIWTQSLDLSEHIARASNIQQVVDSLEEMIGEVDGVLLARDDAENHVEMALPFLKAGIPIYIDKPLALSVDDAKLLISSQQYAGQLFSCSALRYARELHLPPSDIFSLGGIRQVHATVPKDWEKYAIHIIEPVLLLIPERGSMVKVSRWKNSESTTLSVVYDNDIQVLLTTLGATSCPISIRVFGKNAWKDLFFENTFDAFKSALYEFVQGVIHRDVRVEPDFMLEAVFLVEAGRK